MSMTANIDRIEVITSVHAAAALVGGREGADRAGGLSARDVGVAGGTAARDCAKPGIHLVAAVCRGRAVGGRGGRGGDVSAAVDHP